MFTQEVLREMIPVLFGISAVTMLLTGSIAVLVRTFQFYGYRNGRYVSKYMHRSVAWELLVMFGGVAFTFVCGLFQVLLGGRNEYLLTAGAVVTGIVPVVLAARLVYIIACGIMPQARRWGIHYARSEDTSTDSIPLAESPTTTAIPVMEFDNHD